ncbi:MAG TPA: helix-turn-helix domain-containing protein [Acidimicrobiia bacterium]|jgi:AcrR family transcriptional regulator|nr:helix-turn-helix domain-containing protein [Acidimicrobiia bacterium]
MTPRDGAAARPAGRSAAGPGSGRELRARGQRTLRRLLDAGAAVFAERGLHAARVDDIVKAAQTSHGTFYLYFASKEDLFRALAEDVAASMAALARQLPPLNPDRDGYAALVDWLGRFTDLYAQHGALLRTWTKAEIADTELGRVGDDLVAQFARELATRVRAAAPDLDARVAALALVAMIERAVYYQQAEQVRADRDELVITLAAVTHASLFGAAARGVTAEAPDPVLRS